MPDLQDDDLRYALTNFQTLIADGTHNVVDMPSTYDVSRERYRFYKDTGSGYERVNDPTSDASFTDNDNHFLLSCPAGERRELRTAEHVRYVAGFEMEYGKAWRSRANLQDGQEVRVRTTSFDRQERIEARYYNDGGELKAEIRIVSDGSPVNSRSIDVSDVDETAPRISRLFENLYGVGMDTYRETVTEGTGEQQVNDGREETIGVNDDWSVKEFNMHLSVEVDCTNSGQGLDVEAGSMQAKVRGDSRATTRSKPVRQTGYTYGGSGNYEAVAAFRIDPERNNVFCELKDINLSANGDESSEIIVCCFYDDEVTFDDTESWRTPRQNSKENSVIEYREDVDQFTDSTGTLVSNADDPNGRNIGLAATDFNKSAKAVSGSGTDSKRPLFRDEVAVVLLRTDSGNSPSQSGFSVAAYFEQDW